MHAEPFRTAQSDVAPLRSVLVRAPGDAFATAAAAPPADWRALGWHGPPDPGRAAEEHARLVEVLAGAGARVVRLAGEPDLSLDSLYPRDAAVVCGDGAILCRMGKPARRDEPAAVGRALTGLGVPVLGAIEEPGRLEGGDVAWVDERTLAVGRGYRTNAEGIRQLRALLGDRVDALLEVPLPHWRGPGDVFHLMSMYSPLADGLALVHAPLLPVPFREALLGRGTRLVEVPDEEFEGLGCNALALAPGRCVLVEGNPVTRSRLEAAGVEVIEIAGSEMCRKGSGGPTCLTRPLVRKI
ncbi:MAG: arginine deiminase family protein [Gemmatimonadota bacterium]|nr:arginine deiminase family protein [Gemmatimonadota bacterium]